MSALRRDHDGSTRWSGLCSAWMEPVESRRLLSISLDNGVIVVVGTSEDDTIHVGLGASDNTYDVSRTSMSSGESQTFSAAGVVGIRIWGNAGNDSIEVYEQVLLGVTVSGGAGNNSIRGGSGNDFLHGDGGLDTLLGREGDDVIYGDWAYGGVVDAYGDAGYSSAYGDDNIDGGLGNDTIYCGYGNDEASGDSGTDFLFGDVGNDSLWGGDNPDTLDGGDGDDQIYGESGTDYMVGGYGNDYFGAIDDGFVDIVDGGPGTDRVSLYDKDANGDPIDNFTNVEFLH